MLAALLAAEIAGAAGTFYVDAANPQASTTGPGTATQPYLTISAAVAARGGAGTTILVAPSVYREQVTIGASGSAASPFVIRATAPGVIVDGADSFAATSRWVLSSGNVWRASTVTWSPSQVIVDGARLTASSGSTSSLPVNAFRYVNGSGLYVNLGGGNPGARQTFVGRRSYGFRLSARSYVTIDGFTVIRADDRAFYLASSSNQCVLSGNTVTFAARYGINLSGCTGGRVTGNVVTDNLDNGIYLSSSTTGVLVDGNECARNSRAGGSAAHGIALSGAPSNRIERNRLHHNSGAGVQFASSSNNGVSIQNRSWSNGTAGLQVTGSTGVRSVGDVAYANTRRGFTFESSSTGGNVANAIAANNGITASEYDLYVESASTTGFGSNDNVIWNTTAQAPVRFGSTAYASLAAFAAATGNDSRSAQTDPRFVSPATGDFRLAAGSPAIDAANSGVTQWPPTDAENHARFDDGSTPDRGLGPVPYADRGALEYAPLTQPPVVAFSVTPGSGLAPLDVVADATGSYDPDGVIATYRFDFGDGTVVGPQTAPSAAHRYGAGTWTARVTVTDDLGSTASAQSTVLVSFANQAPVAALSLAPGPFEGLRDMVTDPNAVLATPIVPRPGYLAPGLEPTFATTLTRVGGDTGAPLSGPGVAGTWGSDARHHYSKDEPWNSDGTLIAIDNSGSPGDLLLDGETYAVVAGKCSNYDRGDDRWHPSLPHVRINVKNSLLSWFDVVDCVMVRSWTLPFPVDYFGESEGNASRDGRFVALSDGVRAFVVDMDPQPPFAPYPAPRIGPAFNFSSCGLPDCTVGWVSISPSGKYVVVKYSQDHPRVLDVDPVTLALTPHPMPAGSPRCAGDPAQGFVFDLAHADMTLNPFDHDEDVLIGQEHCGWHGQVVNGQPLGYTVMVRLRDGAVTSLTTPENEAHVHHVSTRNTLRPGWAYASYRPEPGMRFSDEVIAVKLDGSHEVQRFAHKHGLITTYRTEAHAVPTPDGRRVMFASNWALDCASCPAETDIKAYVADARASASPGDTAFRQTVRIDASGSRDPDGGIASYRFDFGDGAGTGPQSWPITSHTFRAGTWPVKVVVRDALGGSDSATAFAVVQPPNRAPNGVIDLPAGTRVVVPVGDSIAFAATGTDPDENLPLAFDWRFGGGAANRSVEDPGTVRFDSLGTFVVTLTVSDALGLADPTPDSVTVVVALDRDPVVTAPGPFVLLPDSLLAFTVTAVDSDGTPITDWARDLSALPAVNDAAFTTSPDRSSGLFSWRPRVEDARSAPYAVAFTAFNAKSGSDTTSITVTRRPVATAPDTVRGTAGAPIAFGVSALDPDGDPIDSLTADSSDLPHGNDATFAVTAGNTSGTFSWTPSLDDGRPAPYLVTFRAANAFAGSAATWVLVEPVARPPRLTLTPRTLAVTPDSLVTIGVAAVDPNGDAVDSITVDASTLPAVNDAAYSTSSGSAGTFHWRPVLDDVRHAPFAIGFTAWNTLQGSDTAWVTVSRAPVVAAPDTVLVAEGDTLRLAVTAADPDGDPVDTLAAKLSALPENSAATFTVSDDHGTGTLVWKTTFADGRAAPYSVIFTASNLLAAADTTWIVVNPVDRAPAVLAPSTASGAEGQLLTIAVTASDPDGDAIASLAANLAALPPGASFTANATHTGGTLQWTPGSSDGRAAPYLAIFTATNAASGADTTSITIADVASNNLVGNPSFEASLTGWNASGASTLSRVSGGYDGASACKVQGGTTTAEFGINDGPNWVASVTAGTRYRYSAWVKSSVGAGRARLKVREYNAGTQVGATMYSANLTLSASWQNLTVDAVAQQTGSTLDMQVLDLPTAPSESFLIDLVSITIVPPASAAPVLAAGEAGRAGDAPSAGSIAVPAGPVPRLAGSVRVVPHPVAGSSRMRFAVPRAGALDVRLYDSGGREIRTLLASEHAPAGWFEVPIESHDARGVRLPAGVYFYRIRSADGEARGRVVIVN